jgi:vancomycin aglycone glucosyltransferase
VQVAAGSVAEHHGVPYRYVSYCPGMFPSAAHAPFMLEWQSLPRWLNRVVWWAFRGVELPLRGALNRQRARLGLNSLSSAFDHFITANPLLATWRELAPMPTDSALHVEQVGYLHPELGEPLPDKLESFLESGPPPVYIGFGSMPDADAASTTRLLLEAVSRRGTRALVSQGWAGLAEGPLPEGVMAVPSVCHARLFPRCAAIVHHGGAGTTSTAARAGVPQVIVPHLADQFYWARRVSLMGLGPPPVYRRRLDSGHLADALRHAGEDIVVDRARQIGAELQGQDPVSRAVAVLLS